MKPLKLSGTYKNRSEHLLEAVRAIKFLDCYEIEDLLCEIAASLTATYVDNEDEAFKLASQKILSAIESLKKRSGN